jgi:hypothetical protein
MSALLSAVLSPHPERLQRAQRSCGAHTSRVTCRRRVPAFASAHGLASAQIVDAGKVQNGIASIFGGQITIGTSDHLLSVR